MDCNYEKSVKQGTTHRLDVSFSGDSDEFSLDDIERIEFVFKQQRSKDAPAIKTVVWDAGGSGDALRIPGTNTVSVPFSEADTYKFKSGKPFYMDTKISIEGSGDNPPTNVVQLTMNDTLFAEVQE